MKNKKDCSLVVQLLKCNQSLDRQFVSQKMDMVSNTFFESNFLEKLTSWRFFKISLQNRRISGASAIHERVREARCQKKPGAFSGLALILRARSCIALAPLIRLFCRSISQFISILAIFCHPHFLMGYNHFSSTALQNKTIIVQLPMIDICFRDFQNHLQNVIVSLRSLSLLWFVF